MSTPKKGISMNAKNTFVVLDLETTGQSVAKGGRIIQIGMTFIRQRKIVDHFESFVNPGQLIDRQIQQLTHISQKDVQHAPYFDEIAPMLQSLLSDAVIIAHNINFDYPYLNDEFERTGFPALQTSAIDTVQLAQILLPTAPGYRLLDLTTYLDINLVNAHRANADAHATALLFLEMWRRAEQLPSVVLQQLQTGEWPLLRQTQQFLKLVRPKGTQQFDVQDKVALQINQQVSSANLKDIQPIDYPVSVAEKRSLFGEWLSQNEAQEFLMDRTHRFLTKRSDGLLTVLTAPRMGKTIAYLIPVILSQQNTVLLTNDDSLQMQQLALLEKLSSLFDVPFRSAILYDPSAYIDLPSFIKTLAVHDSSQIQFAKARLLVWLTQTKTGLLQEISIGLHNLDIIQDIRGNEKSEFFKRARQNADVANVLIMNFQTFFTQDQSLRQKRHIQQWPLVVMETPAQFVDDLRQYFHVSFNVTALKNDLKGIAHQEITGLTHKQRLFIRQSTSEALKILKQLTQSESIKTNLKRAERLALVISHISQLLALTDVHLPQEFQLLESQLDKITRLQAQDDVVSGSEQISENGQSQTILSFDVLERAIYHKKFVAHIRKLLVVSEFLPTAVTDFLRDVPDTWTMERDFVHDDRKPVQLVQLQKKSPILHLQAMTQEDVGEIMIIVPTEERVNHWYQKIKYAVTTNYNIVAEGVTGSLEKIQRQSQTNRQNIVIVTPKIFGTMWQRDQELPAIVLVPERDVWQPVARLASVLNQMQRHQSAMLVTQLNAMQRNRFKQQLSIVPFDVDHDLVTQYHEIFSHR